MQPAGGAGVQRPVVHPELARALVDQVPPQPLQEPEDAGDVVGMPRAVAIQRAHRHLVQPQGVGAVGGVDLVRADAVLQALAHLPGAPGDGLAAVTVAAVAGLGDLGGRHVHPAGIGERVGQDVALVQQPRERLRRRDVAQVVQHLVPEAGVQQVEHRVLHAADVQVHPAGRHPVPFHLRIDEGGVVGRVQVAQVIPARPGPLRHGVELAPVGPGAVTEVERDRAPARHPRQRRDRVRGLVAGCRSGPEVGHLGQQHRQHVLGQRDRPVLVVDDRERLTPVALPGEEPVTQPVAAFPAAGAAPTPASRWPPRPRHPGPARPAAARDTGAYRPSPVNACGHSSAGAPAGRERWANHSSGGRSTARTGSPNARANSMSRWSWAGTAMIAPVP